MRHFLNNNKALLVFLFLLFMFRGAVADWHPVPTGSMKPTILEGDVIWHNKIAYDLKLPFTGIRIHQINSPQRGDIVVLKSSSAEKRLIKRLVGLPGDTVSFRNGRLLVNDFPTEYSLTDAVPLRLSDREAGFYMTERIEGMPGHVVHSRRNITKPSLRSGPTWTLTVPAKQVFLLGDSRDNSADSRYYGTFPIDELLGKATHVLMSFNTNDRYKPRLERFFTSLN